MSIFIFACMPSLGFRLIPPESYMTPLPTSTRCAPPRCPVGVYVSRTTRGGSVLPAFTPTIPPQPIAASWSLLNTSTSSPVSFASSTARSANRRAVMCDGGELARSRASHAADAVAIARATPFVPPRPALADDEADRRQRAGRALERSSRSRRTSPFAPRGPFAAFALVRRPSRARRARRRCRRRCVARCGDARRGRRSGSPTYL
jgi:hypothetical protein